MQVSGWLYVPAILTLGKALLLSIEPQTAWRPEHFKKQINLLPLLEIEPHSFGYSFRGLVTLSTKLPCLASVLRSLLYATDNVTGLER